MKRLVLILSLLVTLIAVPVASSVTATPSSAAIVQKGNPDAKVWVNTGSGVYHCPGTRWYGKTKQGEYMTQKQAQEKGHRPAYGKVCN